MDKFPTKNDIIEAHLRIQPYVKKTPILTNHYIDELISSKVFFKCENFQKTGSFKVRGAANKILQVGKSNLLCSHSSGNHAQAVAYMGQRLGIKTKIVMPFDTPNVKKNSVKQYGAEIVESGATSAEQQKQSSRITKQQNGTFIHPYNDFQVITGAATIAFQIYQDCNDFDYIVFPIGGGGLTSGTLLATHEFSSKTIPIGVEPFLARDAYLSLKKGEIVPQLAPVTLAQGVRTGIGDITFSVIKQYLKDIILVEQKEIIEAARILFERMKIVVELSGAIVLAGIIKDPRFINKKVCAIISGGNIDFSSFFSKFP